MGRPSMPQVGFELDSLVRGSGGKSIMIQASSQGPAVPATPLASFIGYDDAKETEIECGLLLALQLEASPLLFPRPSSKVRLTFPQLAVCTSQIRFGIFFLEQLSWHAGYSGTSCKNTAQTDVEGELQRATCCDLLTWKTMFLISF